MKKRLPTILLGFSISLSLAFKVGDEVELTNFLNGRTHPNFLSTTKNVKARLPKGTVGDVVDIKKFSSGNAGIKLKIKSGPRANQSYWVYFNQKDASIKLTEKGDETPKPPQEISLEKEPTGTITRDTSAIRDPKEEALTITAESASSLNEQIKSTLTPQKADCPPELIAKSQPETQPESTELRRRPAESEPILSSVSEDNYNITDLTEPFRERPRGKRDYPGCSSTSNGAYIYCKNKNGIEGLKLINGGPNKIVTANEYYINRTFDFEFPDRARSDMKLVVSDSPDDTTSHTTYNIMLFFPRSVLPSIKEVDDELHVTLPNKEVVRYNAKTKEIIGGVLTEGKMAQDPKNKNKAVPANIKYTGEGVLIRASKSGDLPYGDIELRDGSKARSTTVATVSKKGHKDCQIPSKDIWYNTPDDDVLIKPELASDAGLDSFLKKKCGFSLF